MEHMERLTQSFKNSVLKPKTVKDSRFVIRKLPVSKEDSTVFTYSTPGKGPNGEHIN